MTGRPDERARAVARIRLAAKKHYDEPKRLIARIRRFGYVRVAKALRDRMPSVLRFQSGDLGEILATDYVRSQTEYIVPINRLQWKDGRNMPLRGDDLLGFAYEHDRLRAILKGESKSRQSFYADDLAEAIVKLNEHSGRPSPHSVGYVADRLHELGMTKLSEDLDAYNLLGVSLPIRHFVFSLSGNEPTNTFQAELAKESAPGIERLFVGVVVDEHGDFVAAVYQ